MVEERHRPTVRMLLGSIHTTAKEQPIGEVRAQSAPLPPSPQMLHRLSSTASEGGDVMGSGVLDCVHTRYQPHRDTAHQGQAMELLPEVSVQLGNQMSEQVSRDSEFIVPPGSVSFN